MQLKGLCSIVKGSACLMLHLNVCQAAIENGDLEGLQKYICVCVFSLWLRLGVNGPEHNRNDRFEELLGYMSCVNFQE